MAKTLKQLVEQKQRIVQGRFQSEPAKKDIHGHTIVTPQMTEDENLQEGRPDQRHPLEGHEYHKKSNAELIHIAKDAHKAAEAMKSHNTDAENKYRDQANDSATVRYFRQKSGMPNWYKKKYGHVNESTEQLDELDTSTLQSYSNKAAKSNLTNLMKPGEAARKTAAKRFSGMMKAGEKIANREVSKPTNEEFDLTEEQIEEIAGANMDTRAVHSHLKKRGWKLTRTSGGHDVYTHEKSPEHISVPRHKQLKAPLIMGILKSAKNISEAVVDSGDVNGKSFEVKHSGETNPKEIHKQNPHLSSDEAHAIHAHTKSDDYSDARSSRYSTRSFGKYNGHKVNIDYHGHVNEQMANDPFAPPYAKKTGTYADRIAKNTATTAAKRQAGTIKPNISLANTYGESRKASIVREAMKDAQERDEKKKEKKEVSKSGKDKFEPDPELSSDIIRHE